MSHQTYQYNTSWEKVARLFPVGHGLRILDVGCGDGRLVSPLVSQHTVYGLDQSTEGLAQAVLKGLTAQISNVDGTTIPFTDLDVILALDILEHLQHLSQTLENFKKSLRSNGSLILSLPNHFDLRTRLEILFGRGIIKWSQRAYEHKAWEYSHLHFLKFSETLQMLREHGFYPDIIQFNFMSQGLLPTRFTPKLIRRWLTRLWPNLWSGKFVIRARLSQPPTVQTLILDTTPPNF